MPQKKKSVSSGVKKSAQKGAPKSHAIPLRPLGDKVVVRPLSSEEMGTTTLSGIIIPDSAQEKPEQGTVVAVGQGKWDEDGERRIPLEVSVGDRVLFSKYGYDKVKVDGVEYYVLGEEKILAIVK